MVEAGELFEFDVCVAGGGEGGADGGEVLCGGDLDVFGAVECEDRAGDVAESGGGVVGEEEAEPGSGEGFGGSIDAVGGEHRGEAGAELLVEGSGGGGGLFGLKDEVDEVGFIGRDFGGEVGGHAGGEGDEAGLFGEDLRAGDAGSGEEDEEGDGLIACRGLVFGCNHGRDEAAFGVAEEAGAVGVDFGAGAEVGEASFGVGGELGGGGGGDGAGGVAYAAVVIAEDGDAVAGEVVGENEEGFVAEDGLVAVVRAGAGDEEDRGKGAGAGREGEGGGQGVAGGGVSVSDVDGLVGEGWDGILGAFGGGEVGEVGDAG